MPRVPVLLVVALTAMLIATACAAEDVYECPAGSELNVEYRLFMGRNSDGVEVVSDQDWAVFLQDIVTPRFPNGLTVLDGEGQWQLESGDIERERSKVLVILSPQGGDAQAHLAEVATSYKDFFDQGVVIQTSAGVCTSFY